MSIKKIEKFIDKGASVKSDSKMKESYSYFNLRIPERVMGRIEDLQKERLGVNKTFLIIELIERGLEN